MMFKQKPLPVFTKLKVLSTDKGRYYDTPMGPFPSVTTVISAYQNKEYLIRWKERIGEEEANRITRQAQNKGNAVHKMAELYLTNDPDWCKDVPTPLVETFKQIQPVLDANVELVYGCEIPLYSSKLHIAGTTDSVVMWKGWPSILDFKTSKRPVGDNSDKLRFYKLQATIYAMLVQERYNLDCPYSHILIMIDNDLPKLVSFRNTAFRIIAEELISRVVLPT